MKILVRSTLRSVITGAARQPRVVVGASGLGLLLTAQLGAALVQQHLV